jgi:streptogramin lyase
MTTRARRSSRLAAVSAVLGLALVAGAATAGDGIPKPLSGIVYSGSKRPIEPVVLDGAVFQSVSTFSDLPYLLWPMDPADRGVETTTPAAVGAWLGSVAEPLGYAGFTAVYRETFEWHGHEVHAFDLSRDGVRLHDAEVLVHFDKEGLIGIVNHLDGRLVAIDPLDGGPPNARREYYAVPTDGGYRAIVVRAAVTRLIDRQIVEVIDADGTVLETEQRPDAVLGQRDDTATFTEYTPPGSTFPDQISVAEDGKVWFSEPNLNKLMSFDPVTEQFASFNTTGGSGPDGMIVGTQGRVWTGLYYAGGLGVLDTTTGIFSHYNPPYSPAAMAIPVETTDGKVWVTDHQYNRISEFNPATGTWVKSVIMPTSSCWVVQGHEDPSRQQVYFTEYNANRLGRINLGGNAVTDIAVPGGGPAFCVYADDKVYYSRWNESGIGVLDVPTGVVTEFEFPVANEPGGPMWLRPSGDIVVGTRGQGYVMVFHIATQAFSALKIPTNAPGLKDGMTVGADDIIWFTETGARKLGKLEFCLNPCVADFNGDGSVNSLDVLAYLNAWAAGDPAADVNGDGAVNSLDVLFFLNLWNAGC